jgi:hypothetical protein
VSALRDAILFALLFGGAVLVNTLLGLLLLDAFGSLEPSPTGTATLLGRVSLRRLPID